MAISQTILAILIVAYAAGVLALVFALAARGASDSELSRRSIEIFLWPLLVVLLVLCIPLYAAWSAGEWYGKRQAAKRGEQSKQKMEELYDGE